MCISTVISGHHGLHGWTPVIGINCGEEVASSLCSEATTESSNGTCHGS